MHKRKSRPSKEIKTAGMIIEYDDINEGRGIMIVTNNDEYLVKLDKKGKKLQDLVLERVMVTGTLGKGRNKDKIITINDYRLFDGKPE